MTAAKKATAPSPKRAGPAPRKAAPAKPASKRSPSVKPAAKKAGVSARTAKKAAPAARKPAASATKSSPTARKPASAAKKATPATSAKKAPAAAAKKAPAPVAKKALPAAKKAKAPAPPRRPTIGPYAKEAKFLEEQRALLLEERQTYAGQATDLRAEADSLALEREPGDVQFDEESGEGGTVTVDRERNLALSAQALAAVEEIDDAFRKIERKTYGGCERCHQAIPKTRLRALPFARLCVACKSGGLSRR